MHLRWLILMASLALSAPARAAPAPATAEPGAGAEPARPRVAEPPPARDAPPTRPRVVEPRDLASADPDAKPPADGTATPKEMTPPIKKKNLSHRLQVSVDLAVGLGAAFRITYQDTTWCGRGTPAVENDSFCTGLAPVAMDIGLGFGVLHALEILAEFRIGFMNDTLGNRPLMLMPGVRLWIDPKLPFKIGLAFQLVIDLTKQDSAEQRNNLPENGQKLDFGARFYAQFQYDFLRYIGIFGRIGLVGTFQKWIGFNLEAQLGVQARFP